MSSLRSAAEQGAFDDVLRSSKIVVVDFYTPSCVLCKKMEPMLVAAGEKLGDRVKIVKVDAEANLPIAAKYDVQGVPTLLLIEDGELRDRKTGFMTASMLRAWISPYLN
jgi:thioredoxin 1